MPAMIIAGIHYDVAGEGDPVLLIHGLALDGRTCLRRHAPRHPL